MTTDSASDSPICGTTSMAEDVVHDDSPSKARPARPFSALQDTGLLWAINRVLLHPRGFALAFHRDKQGGELKGWSLQGDGKEPWQFSAADDE